MRKTKRLAPEVRQDQILEAAIRLSEKQNYRHITREQIAKKVGCAPGLISFYFGGMLELRHKVMSVAIERENLTILMQGLVCNDPMACRAPKKLRQKAAEQFNA